MARRTAYARKTEVTRNDHAARSHDARWHARTGDRIPDELINDMPAPNSSGSLRYHLARECQRYHANEAIMRDAKAIVQEAIAKGIVRVSEDNSPGLL